MAGPGRAGGAVVESAVMKNASGTENGLPPGRRGKAGGKGRG